MVSVKGIKSNKTLSSRKQLCAGYKIKDHKTLFFQYEGTGKKTKFKQIKPIKKYRSPQKQVLSILLIKQ